MMEELDGQYSEEEGRASVTFVRSYPVSAEDVWDAVSTPEGLDGWFPSAVVIDPSTHTVTLTGDPNMPPSSERITAWEPPERWAFDWGEDTLEFVVQGSGTDAELTLRNWLGDRTAAARNAAGWHVCLAELAVKLGGGEPGGPHRAGALAWQPLYDGYIREGLPFGAPIPGQG
ncbi:SRPBCC domain-containing protein [Sinomonas terrae]|uniref:SRPBCC domain-containing protein n=1 Tax=Sinomonas terrae TaxID=2908838 RepID=A0ABS9U741_9MICC|nr:SRPBCC domain-containing protein [Sinomonas terrae]MCH6472346.1 SRPBCC domain-containing protein [Sinomonas terrae]